MLQQTTSSVLVARTSHMNSPTKKKIWRKSSSVFCRVDSWEYWLPLPVHLMKVAFQRKLTVYPFHLSALLTVYLYCICHLPLLRRTCSPQQQGFLLVFITVMPLKFAMSDSTLNGWSDSIRKKNNFLCKFVTKKWITWENTKQNPD